jgi:phthalate 4,5-dioxygenase oxygenase subunit
MGDLRRRYWIPILLAEELRDKECSPVRVKILSECLLAWRDTQGHYALTDEFCAHRGVSLSSRIEESGLRCPYHGWKYDRTGQCIDVPSEPEGRGFCKEIKLKSYPLIESGGILWAYMGPPQFKPPLPAFEWMELPPMHRYFSKRWQECNYLQAMEGASTRAMSPFCTAANSIPIHCIAARKGHTISRIANQSLRSSRRRAASTSTRDAMRGRGHYYWRISQWIMPWYTLVPPYGDNALNAHAWVPIDDENCFTWTFTSSDAAVERNGARYHAQGRRHSCRIDPRQLPADYQQGQ